VSRPRLIARPAAASVEGKVLERRSAIRCRVRPCRCSQPFVSVWSGLGVIVKPVASSRTVTSFAGIQASSTFTCAPCQPAGTAWCSPVLPQPRICRWTAARGQHRGRAPGSAGGSWRSVRARTTQPVFCRVIAESYIGCNTLMSEHPMAIWVTAQHLSRSSTGAQQGHGNETARRLCALGRPFFGGAR